MDNLKESKIDSNISALYGIFNLDMHPVNTINVTNNIKAFIKGNTITIPKNLSFRDSFGIIENGRKKYLQITVADNVYNIAEEQYIEDIEIDFSDKKAHIKIVYYLYLNPNSNWRAIVSGQLLQLKSYGVLSEADLYIHITDCYNLLDNVQKLIREIVPAAIISCNYENQFEYPGIKLIYDLANKYPEDIFIYFHAKGMSYNIHSRSIEEVTIFTQTFQNWRKNIQFLNQNGIQKIGLFPAVLKEKKAVAGDIGGWIWYNYWYATGKYLSNCPNPLITKDKYYYEGWLSIQNNNESLITNDCMSLYKIKSVSKNYFTPTEADYHLNLIPKQFLTFKKRIIQVLGNPLAAHYYFHSMLYLNSIFKSK